MARSPGPHELLKTILQGAAPPRPLFLPIVFSHAARIENLPLPVFLSKPTKIVQALRQMRGHLRSDGITCYFDPYLEIEALGAVLDWGSGGKPAVRWAHNPLRGDLPAGLHAMEELPARGRIPIAVEVIRRLKSMVRDECLLTVGIRGPFSLAAQLMRAEQDPSGEEISEDALQLASEAIVPVARALVEAGADVVLISEEMPSLASSHADLASVLATTINIVRFYQAIPAVLLGSASQHLSLASQEQSLECIVCPELSGSLSKLPEEPSHPAPATLGVAIPVSAFSEPQPSLAKLAEEFRRLNSAFPLSLITTSGDFPQTADLRDLSKWRDLLIA
jgi:uroporphyrinogen decarboxylase-like protein